MKIAENLWLESAYYVDIDDHGQLRIAGPNNHLYFGLTGFKQNDYQIDSVSSTGKGEVTIKGSFARSDVLLHDPAIGPMLRVRSLIEPIGRPKPTFAQVMRHKPDVILPHFVSGEQTDSGFEITYRRFYENQWYGVKLRLAKGTDAHRRQGTHGYWLKRRDGKPIGFKLQTETKKLPDYGLRKVVGSHRYKTKLLGEGHEKIEDLLDRLRVEIEFLIRNNRTSGFDYGTIFPRDWMEAADLGEGDLRPEAVRYMYRKALELVSSEGLGWHENIIGELEAEKSRQTSDFSSSLEDLIDRESRLGHLMEELVRRVQEMYVIRNMIDIEPHYLLGLQRNPIASFSRIDQMRLRRAAHFVLAQAESNRLITFKRIPDLIKRHSGEEYYGAGNWRDSLQAFKMIHPVIAPYDVNAVFYPEALRIIQANAGFFGVSASKIASLIQKWTDVKELYRFTNPDGTQAYAVALYDVKQSSEQLEFRKLEVNHTDEAYSLFYGDPTAADIESFCHRLLSADYFYTPSGPTIVGAKDGYSTLQYHGKVIWTKQTAFVVAGLARMLKQGRWPESLKTLMAETIITTAGSSLAAIHELDGATELHYSRRGRAHNYNDQPRAEGPMNKVQLWSAVGARTIVSTYLWALEHLHLPRRTVAKIKS